MDLPDCPPGAEGYHDTVTEVAKRPGLEVDEISSTKAEKEFLEHLNSLKIQLENGVVRCMVERRGRDVAGKWVYLCYPCAAICSGEPILQIHLSGKKHKLKLGSRQVWPVEIFDHHPHILNLKQQKVTDKEHVPDKIVPAEVHDHSAEFAALEAKYGRFKNQKCEIQKNLDNLKIALVGVEYLVEFPPEQDHHERRYLCILCNKQGHPRTIINHLTCFWHQFSYFNRHFQKAVTVLAPYCRQHSYRPGVTMVMTRLAKRIEDKFGRLKPLLIDSDTYEKEKATIGQWVSRSHHFSERSGNTFEEVIDIDLITSLSDPNSDKDNVKRDPSPPVTTPPVRPTPKNNAGGAGARGAGKGRVASTEPISDDSDVEHVETTRLQSRHVYRERAKGPRYSPYKVRRREPSPPVYKTRYGSPVRSTKKTWLDKSRPPNYEHKVKLSAEKVKLAEESAKKTLLYHEKNPEKHPLYPEEWKKFWNKRYKEIQAEGKDPMKHDFKPEWIVYWTNRMKELHEQELRLVVNEIYRKLCLTPPPDSEGVEAPRKASPRRSPVRRSPARRSPARRSPARRSPARRSPARRSPARRSPARRSPARRSPARRSPVRRSPARRSSVRRSPARRSPARRSPARRSPVRISPPRRSPGRRPSPRRSPSRKLQPKQRLHSRSRSPLSRHSARPHIELESLSGARSQSPLSQRQNPLRNRSPAPAPALQTVLISDDELKDDDLSPWNSDSLESLGSLPDARSPVHSRSRAGSSISHNSRSQKSYRMHKHSSRGTVPLDVGPADTVVATLRLLVALEDYMGSLGPKIVDLLTEALKMEKERPNSSEELLDRPAAVALLETAKEKLKGAVQVGLVRSGAVAAARGAIVRAAALLHQADRRAQTNKQKSAGDAAVAVAGVGAVDRAEIAAQMAAALVAQGKTDVSAEELAQLVDAVVGMAEAKKREAEEKKSFESVPPPVQAEIPQKPPAPATKSGTALQLLQNAYDEYEKKMDKEDTADAMDGLSDSDLETLLKNFNELSAEEQHSLIGYLKKLEARDPKRVERLREYVSDAAPVVTAPTPAGSASPAPAPPAADPPTAATVVHLDSDDDEDYTVDDVLKSANLKVKEDQMRHEMEIVKKSLEEVKKTESPPREARAVRDAPTAANLLAMVQASLQSTQVPAAATATATATAPTLPTFTNENSMQQPPNTQSRLLDDPSALFRGTQPTFNTQVRSYGDALENQQNEVYSRGKVLQQSSNPQDNSSTLFRDNVKLQAPMQPRSYSDSPQNQQSGDRYEFSSDDVSLLSTDQQFRSFDDSTFYSRGNVMQQTPNIQTRSYGEIPRNVSNQDMSFNAPQGSGPRHNFNGPHDSGPRQHFNAPQSNAPRQPFGAPQRYNAPQGMNIVSRNQSEYGGNSRIEPQWEVRQQNNISQDRYPGGGSEAYERDYNYGNSNYQEDAYLAPQRGQRGNYRPPHLRRGGFARGRARGAQY